MSRLSVKIVHCGKEVGAVPLKTMFKRSVRYADRVKEVGQEFVMPAQIDVHNDFAQEAVEQFVHGLRGEEMNVSDHIYDLIGLCQEWGVASVREVVEKQAITGEPIALVRLTKAYMDRNLETQTLESELWKLLPAMCNKEECCRELAQLGFPVLNRVIHRHENYLLVSDSIRDIVPLVAYLLRNGMALASLLLAGANFQWLRPEDWDMLQNENMDWLSVGVTYYQRPTATAGNPVPAAVPEAIRGSHLLAQFESERPGSVRIQASSQCSDNDVRCLLHDDHSTQWISRPRENSYVAFQFPARVCVQGYRIKSGSGGCYPKSWAVEFCHGGSWTTIHEQNETTALVGEHKSVEYRLRQELTVDTADSIRIRQTGPNSNGNNTFKLCYVELLGERR